MGENKIRLHRDKEATQKSGQLMEEGYYGINRQICAVYALDPVGSGSLLMWEDEDVAIRELMIKISDGWIVAPMIYKNWCQNSLDETDDEIMSEITGEYFHKWALWMYEKYDNPKERREADCYQFLKQMLIGRDSFLETQLIQFAQLRNALSQEQAITLRQQIQWDAADTARLLQEKKLMAGFAFQSDAMEWQYVHDAYLPTIYRKRMSCIEKMIPVSPIFLQTYESIQDKEHFSDCLHEVINQTVLNISMEIAKYGREE